MIKLCEGIMNNDKNIKVKAEKCLTLIRSEKRVGAIQDADTVLADIIDAVDIEVEGIGEEAIKLVTKSEDFAASCKLFNLFTDMTFEEYLNRVLTVMRSEQDSRVQF